MEGPGVDRLSIAHCAYDGGLPLNDPDTEVLGLHLLALLVGYDELAEVLLWPVRVPLWPWVVPIVIAVVIVNSWWRRSGGQGVSIMGGPQGLRWGLRWGNKGVSCGHCMQHDPQGVAHWIISTNSGWRGVLSPE